MKKYIWIDAKDFTNYGGWKLDTQFTHLMGSSYLIACEKPGKPVEDARTKLDIVESGMYRVFVRTRNWNLDGSPGKFKVLIDKKESEATLGTLPSNDWIWQIAGDFDLAEGEHDILLRDLTGYFGRCSSIVLTNDMNYVPKRPIAEFENERAWIKEISLEPVFEGEYDVVVVGAGPSGIPAAIAASRNGAKTLVISNRNIIGGNASEECGVGFNGAAARNIHVKEGGIVEEIFRIKGKKKCSWTEAMVELCEAEKNLTIVSNLHVCSASTNNGKINYVIARHTLEGTRHRFDGKIFVDATGDAWLTYHAGGEYRIGREAKWQYNEEFAPVQPDLLTMSGSVMQAEFEDVKKPVEFTAPSWAPKFPKGEEFGRNLDGVHQYWWNEAPNTYDDVFDAEVTRDKIMSILVGFFDYLKNGWVHNERAINYDFTHIHYINAKRESRRMVGDYVLTQNDCVNQKEFDDVIAYSGWPIDLHHPKGMYSGKEGPYFSNTHVPVVQIPYRCVYSSNIENLFAAGRNASVSHVALGTTRVQSTIAIMSQAVGIAAVMCLEKDMSARELGEKCIDELQQKLILQDLFLPSIKSTDENDLARKSSVTAKSYEKNEVFVDYLGKEGRLLPLDCQRASFIARELSEKIENVYLKVANETDKDIPLTIHVREEEDPDGFVSKKDLCVMTKIVPANVETYIEFPVNLTIKKRYLWVMTDIAKGLSWRVLNCPPLDFTRSERCCETDEFPNIRNESHMLFLKRPCQEFANCEPSNVINGYNRIVDKNNYCWVSEKEMGLPQWIQLSFDDSQKINEIHLAFDSDMNNMPRVTPIEEIPERLITDYDIQIQKDDIWETIVSVKDNIQRKRIHKFKTVNTKSFRVLVKDTGDHKTARIMEIRSYLK